MRGKAPNGEGTVGKRPDGRYYAAKWMLDSDGKRKRKYFYSWRRKDCTAWLHDMNEAERAGNRIRAQDKSDMEFGEYLLFWFGKYYTARDSSKMNARTYIEKYVCTRPISKIKLRDLSPDDLQDFVLELELNGRTDGKGGLSPKTIRSAMGVISKALHAAKGMHYLNDDPSEYITLPKVKHTEVTPLTDEEIRLLLSAVQEERWGIGVQLQLFCGLRRGEVTCLSADDFQYDNHLNCYFIQINKSLKRTSTFQGGESSPHTSLMVSEPKTDSSYRMIPLNKEVSDAVIQHIDRQKEEAAHSYGLYENKPFFISNELGQKVDPSTYSSWFQKMVKKAGITRHLTTHQLRHSYACMLLRNGVNLKNISALLGHASISTSCNYYISLDMSDKYSAVSHLNDITQSLLGANHKLNKIPDGSEPPERS